MTGPTVDAPPRLRDLASMVRSKNAGPFVVTIDLFFASAEPCRRVLDSDIVDPARIGALYVVDPASVMVCHVPHAAAIKITLPRPLSAGDVGDRDIAGGQQFARLLDQPVTGGTR
jgi:hypothetical protein